MNDNWLSNICDRVMGWFMPAMMLGIVAVTIILIPIGIYAFIQTCNDPTFSLNKKEWVCTNEEQYQYTITVLVGKVMIPQVHTGTRCTSYSRAK